MLPLFGRNPTRKVPVVTIGLIAANLAVFIYMLFLSAAGRDIFIYRFSVVPWEVIHAAQLPLGGLQRLFPFARSHCYNGPRNGRVSSHHRRPRAPIRETQMITTHEHASSITSPPVRLAVVLSLLALLCAVFAGHSAGADDLAA